jgi:hypothetical protein
MAQLLKGEKENEIKIFKNVIRKYVDMHSGVIDTAVTLDLIFERLWLPLKGITFEKTYIGKLSCNVP